MVLPRDTYAGPVLAGQRWRNRGQGGHDRYLVTVIRLASNSVQVVVEGAGGAGGGSGHTRQRAGHTRPGKRYNVPLDIFRNSYVLVSQPKGYKEPTALDEALVAKQLADTEAPRPPAEAATSTAFGDLYSRSALVIDPVPITDLHETIEVISAARVAFANPPEDPDPMPETPPETPPLEAPIAPPEPEPNDPEALFATAGETIIDRLEKQITGLQRERADYAALLDDLDARLARLHDRRSRIETAVLAAIGALQEEREAVPIPPEPPSGVDQSVAQENPVPIPPESVTESSEATAPPEGRVGGGRRTGQREFLLAALREARVKGIDRVRVADLAVAYAETFGLPLPRARMNVSGILIAEQKRSPAAPDWPVMLRVMKGVYAFLG